MTDETQRVYPALALATSRLIERLKGGEPGDTVTDEELTAIVGNDTAPSGKAYKNLQSAVRWVRRDGVVWSRVRGEGVLKCLQHRERTDVSESYVQRSGRAAKTALQVARATRVAELSSDEAKRHTAIVARAAMQAAAGERRVTDAIVAGRDRSDELRAVADRVGQLLAKRDSEAS